MRGFLATQEPGAQRLPDAGEVREVLREILAGPEFATLPENSIAALLAWALGKLQDLWLWLRELLGDQPGAAAIVTLLIVTAVVVIAVVLAQRYAPRRSRESEGAGADGVRETPVTAHEWLNLATELAGGGELRPAATALYQGFLLTLDRCDMLSFHGSKTPGDYTLELARGGGGAAAGARFLDSFQDFSFGPDRPTAEGYAGLARLAREAGCATERAADESGPGPDGSGGRERDADVAAGLDGHGGRERDADAGTGRDGSGGREGEPGGVAGRADGIASAGVEDASP